MASGILVRLDRTSRRTIGRFVCKLLMSLLAAFVLGDGSYALAVASWLAFYALFAMVSGLLVKETVADRSFNYWDEACWLILAAALLQAVGGGA